MKRNQKGFTLVEIVAVFTILAIIFGIAVFSIFGYLNKGRTSAYDIAEKSLESSASAAFGDCITGTENEFCSKYELPKDKYDFQLVYLDELIEEEYIEPIKDPEDSSKYCDMEKSYVYITNRADMETSKNYDLQYKICLVCGDYQSDYCQEELNLAGNFDSICEIYYDETATTPYDGAWTDQNLYLKFTSTGEINLGIARYEYQIKDASSWTNIDTPQNQDTVTVKITNTTDEKYYQVRAYDDFKQLGRIGVCKLPGTEDSSGTIIKIDKEKLNSASITAKRETAGTTISSGTWSNQNIILTAVGNPTSVPSGYTYQWYKDGSAISGATSKTYTATSTGLYKVKITTGVGTQNVTSSEFNAKIDKVKPVITKIDNPTNENWTDQNFALTITVTETESMIDYYQYKYENTDWKKYANSTTSPFTTTDFENERNEYVYIQVVDKVGNKSEIAKTMIKIDKTDIASVTVTGKTASGTAVSSDVWKPENVVLTGTINPTTVISDYSYQWYKDGSAISGATSISYTAAESGSYTLKVTSGVGKTKTSSAFIVKIDKSIPSAPTITASDSKASGAWHTANFTLTPSGSTATSGITYYYGTSSSNVNTKYTSAVSVNTNTASTTYYFKACNGAGTCSTTSSYVAKLDKATPGTPVITANDGITSGYWHTANVTLNFSGASSTSGITYYYGTSASSMTSTGSSVSYTTNTTGVTYYVKACNGAGTCGATSSYQIKLDKATPATPAITATDGITSGNWHTANVTLNFSGASSTSGITYYYGTSSSSMTSTGSGVSQTTNTAGVTYYVKACNGAGTCGGTASYQIKLDKNAPTITAKSSTTYIDYPTNASPTGYFNITYSTSGGSTSCTVSNLNQLSLGTNTVTCTSTGGNGKTASASVVFKHQYAATAYCTSGTLTNGACHFDSNASVCGTECQYGCDWDDCATGSRNECVGGYVTSDECVSCSCSLYKSCAHEDCGYTTSEEVIRITNMDSCSNYESGNKSCTETTTNMCTCTTYNYSTCQTAACGSETVYDCDRCSGKNSFSCLQYGTTWSECASTQDTCQGGDVNCSDCKTQVAKSCDKTDSAYLKYSCPNGGTVSGTLCKF